MYPEGQFCDTGYIDRQVTGSKTLPILDFAEPDRRHKVKQNAAVNNITPRTKTWLFLDSRLITGFDSTRFF